MLSICRRRTLVATLLAAVSTGLVAAEPGEWTRYRGPNGSGVSDSESIPVEFGPQDFAWKTKLPGVGHASPVIWENRVFLLSADPETARRYVLCYDAADGSSIWQKEFPGVPHHLHLRNSYASSTPTVDAERVYVAWADPEDTTLMALNHAGDVLWRKNLGPWVSMHGFGQSPVLYEDLVILCCLQQGTKLDPGEKPGKSSVVAVNKKTGELVWKTDRRSTIAAYSVPYVRQNASGEDELICASQGDGLFSLDPRTGNENWSVDAFRMRTVHSPIEAGGLIFASTGSGGGGNYTVAVEPTEPPRVKYRVERQAPYVPTPVAYDDLVFLWYDRGFVTCIDAETGAVQYRQRVKGEYSGSPIRVRDKLYCINEDGVVVVLAATAEFKVLAMNPLGEDSRATPAVAGGKMFLRTDSHLICVGGK